MSARRGGGMSEQPRNEQRERIAQVIHHAIRTRYATSNWSVSEWEAAADAVLPFIDEARREERRLIYEDVEDMEATAFWNPVLKAHGVLLRDVRAVVGGQHTAGQQEQR